MALSTNLDQTPKSNSTNPCCDQWKKKCSKLLESRNVLRQALKVLEPKIIECEKENSILKELIEADKGRADSERQKAAEAWRLLEDDKNKGAEKDKEIGRLKALLEERANSQGKKDAELCKLLGEEKNKVAEKEKEIDRLKELLEEKRRRDDSESSKGAEICKLLGEEKNKVAEMEKEIGRLKELLEEKRRKDDSESNKGAEVCKLLGEEKNKVAEMEKDIGRLKELLEEKRRRADSEINKGAEVCKLLGEEKNKVAEMEKEIGRLKELLEEKRRKGDSESNKGAEVCKLLGEEKNKVAEMEKEIGRLKELLEEKRRRADSESNKGAEICKLLGEEKNKVAEKEKEIGRLNELLEEKRRQADSESSKGAEVCKLLGKEKNKVAEMEKEIGRLKELLEEKRRKGDSERKKVAEACKLLEEEKKKAAEKGDIASIEAEKAEKYRLQIGQLEKQVNQAKTKMVSEISTFKELTKKFEAEKRKLLAEKRNAESGMAYANERLEVVKQKVDEEKRRADTEMVNSEEQKALAEDNWNKFMKEKCLTDQMSQQLEENKQMIEDFKQKIHELSSLTKPIEMAADNKVKAESTELKLLKNKLKLEKLRAKHSREKYKLEASRYGILQHELGRLKIDFIQFLHRLDILDASFLPVAGSMHDHKKFENLLDMQNSIVTRQICNPNLSEMHSRFENELLESCNPLRKNKQNTPLLTPGGNLSESITGIGSKLEPLVRGPNRTKVQSSAVNSSTESFSDGQLMGSQDATTFPVAASAKLSEEIHIAKQSICNPSDKSVDVHHRKRKAMHDTVEYIANLSSEKLSDLHGLLYRKVGKCLEGGKEVFYNLNSLQEEDKRAHKKRKKSRREKADVIPWINRDEKQGTEEANTEVYDDANVCRDTPYPAPYNLETTQACGERIYDAGNNFDCIINFDTVTDGSYMKLLELENATSEECFRKAMDFPLSPSLPEIEFPETFEDDNLMNPSLEEALQEDMLTSRTHLLTTHMHTTENLRTVFSVKDGMGSSNNHIPEFCVVFSNIEDSSIISRILIATKNCIARCNLASQTGWAVSNILTVLKMEEKLSQKEKVSALLTLMLVNFTMTATKTFGKLWDRKLLHCLQSYSEHIHTVMSDTETRVLFIENYSLHELLGLVEDFLVEGKVVVNNSVDAEILSCDLRANDFLDCVNEISFNVAASSEQLVAASIIFASVCVATDYVGFIWDTSYHILRFNKWDSLMVLTILHIFAYLGGDKFFNMDNFGLMVMVLKSLIKFLEDGSLSVATNCLPSINQLHTELCMNVKCPFWKGAESIDTVACILLEEIKRVNLSDSTFMSDNSNARQCDDRDPVQPALNKNCNVPCSKNCVISATQPDVLKSVNFCCLSDVLSLVELVANKMSWHWTDTKLVPQLLNILDSCVEQNFAIRIIVLLSQLGRIGVDVGGYEDQGVENLRSYLSAYLCRTASLNARHSLQSAAATALFDLLPLDFEALSHTDTNLPAHSKFVSDKVETLRKWFSGLAKDQQELLSGIFKRTVVRSK